MKLFFSFFDETFDQLNDLIIARCMVKYEVIIKLPTRNGNLIVPSIDTFNINEYLRDTGSFYNEKSLRLSYINKYKIRNRCSRFTTYSRDISLRDANTGQHRATYLSKTSFLYLLRVGV